MSLKRRCMREISSRMTSEVGPVGEMHMRERDMVENVVENEAPKTSAIYTET